MWRLNSLSFDMEFGYRIFGLFTLLLMLTEKPVDSLRQIFLTFSADYLSSPATLLPFCQFFIIFLKKIEEVLENRTHVRLSSKSLLLCYSSLSPSERLPNLPFHYFWRIGCEDGRLRF